MLQSLSRNTLTLLVSNGGGALLSFALSVLIGRALGEDGLGLYAAALAWMLPLWMLAEFGLETLITREVAQDPAAASDYLKSAALARLTLGGGIMGLLLLVAPLITDDPLLVRGLQISAPLIVIGPFVSAFSAVFRARRVMWPVAVLNVGMLAAQFPVTALVFINGGGVLAALAVNTATSAGQMLAAWGIYRLWFHDGARTQQRVSIPIVALLKRAWPFALAAVLAAAQMRLSVILLERLAGTAEAGQYAAASRFVEAGRMLPNALFGALFPALAVLSGDPSALNRLFRRVALGLTAYGTLFGLAAALLAGPLIALTYGAAFEPAAEILQVLAWALLPGVLKGGRILYSYARGREAAVNRVMALAVVVQLALSVALIGPYGASGAALALILTEVLTAALLWRAA